MKIYTFLIILLGPSVINSQSSLHQLLRNNNVNDGDGRILSIMDNSSRGDRSYVSLRILSGNDNTLSAFRLISLTYNVDPNPAEIAGYTNIKSTGEGIYIDTTKPNNEAGTIKFNNEYDNSSGIFQETLRIDENGFVGISTKTPGSKLQVTSGELYIEDIKKGVIMKSPDGGCLRVVIDNSGNLISSSIH